MFLSYLALEAHFRQFSSILRSRLISCESLPQKTRAKAAPQVSWGAQITFNFLIFLKTRLS